MTVLIVGGSSQIGYFLLPRLLGSGEPVLALSRHPRPARAGVEWLQGSLPHAVPLLPPLSAIISFGPLMPFAKWLRKTPQGSATRVIATSSMSAQSKQDSSVPAERDISRLLRDGEAALAEACEHHGCAWTVLRPTLVYGAGLDKSLTPIARRAARLRLFPLPSARGLRQPVHADDIAQAVIAALERPACAGQVLPIGGGERLSAREMFARVRRSLSTPTLPVPLPAALLRVAHLLLPRARGPLSRLNADLVADNEAVQRLLDVKPRAFQPDASMWVPPAAY
jgi:uncharacterized protein YbjT (DUF2867 family)